MPIIEKVYLRKIKKDDTKTIVKWRNSKEIMSNFIIRQKLTEEDHLNWLKNYVETGKVVQFIAYDKDNNKDFASTYLKDINQTHKKAEFGIFIGEATYRGKGYGSEILRQTLAYAFKELKLNKVYARVLSYNEASYNMFLKNGFHQDALLRKDVCCDKKYYDVYIMSLLKEDWGKYDKEVI